MLSVYYKERSSNLEKVRESCSVLRGYFLVTPMSSTAEIPITDMILTSSGRSVYYGCVQPVLLTCAVTGIFIAMSHPTFVPSGFYLLSNKLPF